MTEKKEAGREDPGELKDDANDAGGAVDREGPPKSGAKEATGASGGKSSHNAHKDKVPLFDTAGFQWVVAIILGLITVAISSAMLVFPFILKPSGGGEWYTAFFTVFIGLFGVLITGIFVFMAFRIDRGAKSEAQQVAEEVAKETAEETAKRATEAVAAEIAKKAKKKATEVAKREATKIAKEEANAAAADWHRAKADEIDRK